MACFVKIIIFYAFFFAETKQQSQTVFTTSPLSPFPTTTLSSVVKTSDTGTNGCSGCSSPPCTYFSSDFLTITTCTTAGSPAATATSVISCYVGTFSTTSSTNTAIATTCANEYCKVDEISSLY